MKEKPDFKVLINHPIHEKEVPDLRESMGWDRRDQDYPVLFQRCNFWVSVHHHDDLIGFGYVSGMGLQHGYMEDIMVHPDYRHLGIGSRIVSTLLEESERYGLEIITLTFDPVHARFYETCGFKISSGGVWRK
ncbi:GNAT family N-acetyltransferase [Jeotgalibacillus sp. R-1-5s-1]|uniref:GNAT family N-acetyltransferase n=1 Tax=Jeotgalibacillus sp. R-1-5s-1 TaxID=2555897 RepID=UPI0010694B30|nr:GNAT family N-acetyltransferase [Jeotgalibacillus sp. R-1-5s-1]TFD94538.1 N-acetyltransferase [Jeotgalibacillus sp. R-1-5s-1]